MIEIKEDLMESIVHQALEKANRKDQTQLLSITKKINKIDPIQFFEAAKKTNENRTFWTSTPDEFYLIGVGNAHEIIATESRFQVTEDEWRHIIDEAIVHNPYQVAGTGVVALGGMSFDPLKPTTSLWKNYEPSQFTIPEYTLTIHKDTHYFTVTKSVQPTDDAEIIATEIKRAETILFTGNKELPTGSKVIAKQEVEPEQWINSVKKAITDIQHHKAEKIVLAREVRVRLDKRAEISVLLKRLIHMQQNSFVFAFEQGEDCFIGATPERLVKVEGNELLSTCLAGTAPRGKTEQEDRDISSDLLHDHKNREEHDYVVKMIRRNIEMYCTHLQIPKAPVIYPLQNLQHLYTPVTATLKDRYSIFDVVKQLHPTPALGGVPREESLAFIREHELLDRGWYGAPIGWMDSNENGEFAVAIRSGLIQGDEVSLFAGCGVMKDSDPQAEYEETNIKLLPMLSVMEA